MKLINTGVDYSWEKVLCTTSRDSERVDKLAKQALSVYRPKPHNDRVSYIASKLLILYDLLGDVKGKTILDIGCGSTQSWDYTLSTNMAKRKKYYDPWLCRALHELGAVTIGIDGGESPSEKYRHIPAHLWGFGDIIKQFDDNSIDLACTFSFFDSPSLREPRAVFDAIVRGLEKKVKPEGFFVFEPTGTNLEEEQAWKEYLAGRNK